MAQRSPVASPSDLRSLRRGRGKAPVRPAQIALRRRAMLVLLALLLCMLPKVLGPGFLRDQVRGIVAFAIAVGEWMRAAMVAGFQSIPVR